MDNDKDKVIEPTPEEIAAEAEATKGVTEDEIKEKIASDLELDPDIDADLIEKLAKREKENRDRLSGAIKQKIKYRESLKTVQAKPKEKPEDGKPPKKVETEDVTTLVDQKVNERLEARDLEALDMPDELKEEVKKLAKVNGISIREAAKDPYIKYKKDELEKAQKVKDGTPKRQNRGTYQGPTDPNKPLNPDDYDFNTDEGVKQWRKDKAEKDKQRANS